MRLLSCCIVLVILVAYSSAIEVNSLNYGIIPTYTSSITYEGIQFNKRVRNDSVHVSLNFSVIGAPSENVDISTTFKNEPLTVSDSDEGADAYLQKTLNQDGVLVGFTLNLKNNAANPGVYKLTVKSGSETASADGKVESGPILPVYSKPKRVLQGDPLRISCHVTGEPKPAQVQWFFAPIAVEMSDDKTAISDAVENLKIIDVSESGWKDAIFTSESGVPNDTLRFDAVGIAQNGVFACNCSNSHGPDFTFLLVCVKDRWAALWPFIGIVVEVTVLVAAILLYERHQIRKKPATTTAETPAANAEVTSPNGTAADKNAKPDEVRLRSTKA